MSSASPEATATDPSRGEETSVAAGNYADAFLNLIGAGDSADAALNDLESVGREILDPHPEFAHLLLGPGVSVVEKDRMLVRTLEGQVDSTVLKFLRVLNRRNRLDLLGPITRLCRTRWDRRQGRWPVTVRSASPLDDSQREAVVARVAKLIGGTPVLRQEVDPTLIGGLVIQVGDDVYDASVRNRLQQMRRRIVASKSAGPSGRRDLFEA